MGVRRCSYNLTFLALFCLVIACSVESDYLTTDRVNNLSELDTISVRNISRRIDASEVLGDYEIVFLKTDNLLIGKISKVIIADDKVFIADISNGRIFVFDMEGNMLFHISRLGNGPEEYFDIKDFGVNLRRSMIEIMEPSKRAILQYDMNSGEFVDSKPYDFWPRFFSPLSNGSRLFHIGHIEQEPFKPDSVQAEIYITDSLNRIVKTYLPHEESGLTKVYLMTRQNIYQRSDGGSLIVPMYNNHIYGVVNDRLKPQYYLDFGENSLPQDFVLNFNRNPNDFNRYLGDSGYASYIYDFFESTGHVTFRFLMKGVHHSAIYDKSTGKAVAYRFWQNDEYRFNIRPIGVYGDYHISKLPSESLKERIGFYELNVSRDSLVNHPEYQFLKEMVEQNQSENPVLIFSKFKQID